MPPQFVMITASLGQTKNHICFSVPRDYRYVKLSDFSNYLPF